MALTKWRAAFVDQARRLATLGLTDEEMAQFFAIDRRTLYRWKLRHPDFAAALTIGKDAADARVEQALYHRAIGYAHEAVKIHTIAGEVVQTAYTERYPPDVSAAMFWLKNRQPERWRERSEVNLVADLAQRIAAGRARLIEGEVDASAPSLLRRQEPMALSIGKDLAEIERHGPLPPPGSHQSSTLMGALQGRRDEDTLLSPPFQGGVGGGCERSEPPTPIEGIASPSGSALGSTCPLPGGEREI